MQAAITGFSRVLASWVQRRENTQPENVLLVLADLRSEIRALRASVDTQERVVNYVTVKQVNRW